MTRRLLALVLAPVLLLVGFTGCGGDDDSLSASEYRKQANAACDDGSARLEALGNKLSEDSSEAEVRTYLNASLDEIQQQIDEIRDLEGPDDLEADVHDALDDADQAIDDLRAEVKDDIQAAMAREDDPFGDVNERLVKLGLGQCGGD